MRQVLNVGQKPYLINQLKLTPQKTRTRKTGKHTAPETIHSTALANTYPTGFVSSHKQHAHGVSIAQHTQLNHQRCHCRTEDVTRRGRRREYVEARLCLHLRAFTLQLSSNSLLRRGMPGVNAVSDCAPA